MLLFSLQELEGEIGLTNTYNFLSLPLWMGKERNPSETILLPLSNALSALRHFVFYLFLNLC